MNLVDSSAWIEYLVDGPNAESWVEPIGAIDVLVVPTIVMTEVLRWAHAHSHDALLDQIESLLTRGLVVDLDPEIASQAARVGIAHRLPLADSIIYATAQRHDATVWTQDSDFEGLPGVRFFPKQPV